MRDELLERARQAVEVATAAGAQGAFASASRSRDVEFSMRDGSLETVKDATSRGLFVRLFVDGRYSSSSTNDLRPDAVKAFVSDAVTLTRALAPDEHRQLADPALYAGRSEVDLELVDPVVQSVDRDERMRLCEAAQSRINAADKLISATSGTSDGHAISAEVASNGFEGVQESTYLWTGTEVTLQDAGDVRPQAWYWGGAPQRSDAPSATSMAAEALARAQAMLGASKGPTQKATMVVENRAAGSLVRRLLAGASGRSVQQGRSFWEGKLGKELFSDKLTVVDDPLQKRGLASRLYDGEGIAAKPLTLIEAGVPTNLYLSTYYAAKLGMQPTTGGGSNRLVTPGTQPLSELVADVGSGVFVTSWLGGNADTTTGDFSMGCRGHLITNGQIGAPVTEMNITGNLAELFGRLVALGDDPYPYSSLRAPSLVFEGVQFSGA